MWKRKRDLSIRYVRFGHMFRSRGKLAMARNCYLKALEIREELLEKENSESAAADIFLAFHWLEEISDELGQVFIAYNYAIMRKRIDLERDESIRDRNKPIELWKCLADQYKRLGDLYKIEKEWTIAKRCFNNAIKGYQELEAEGKISRSQKQGVESCYRSLREIAEVEELSEMGLHYSGYSKDKKPVEYPESDLDEA